MPVDPAPELTPIATWTPSGVIARCTSKATNFTQHVMTWLCICLAFVSCKSGHDDVDPADQAPRIQSIHIGEQASTIGDGERLLSMYVPRAQSPVYDADMPRTDRRGYTEKTMALPQHTCSTILIGTNDPGEHDVQVVLMRADTSIKRSNKDQKDRDDDAMGGARDEILAYDTGHASAWILPQVCPDAHGTVRLALWGAPQHTYHVTQYTQASSEAERALYEQGRHDLPGFRPYAAVQRWTLPHDKRARFPLAVSASRCIAIVAHAEGGLEDLDTALYDLQGERLALEVATDQASVVGPWCPRRDMVVRVEFRAYKGQGSFYWQRWEADARTGAILNEITLKSADGSRSRRDLRRVWSSVLPRSLMPSASENASP